MRWSVILLVTLIFLVSVGFAITPEQKDIIGKIRLAEDSIWLFASVFLVFFTYQLRKVYEGGALEKSFLLFTVAFGLMVFWKFLGVIQRVYDIEAEFLKEFIGEGGSGFMIGIAYYAMWKMLKGEE